MKPRRLGVGGMLLLLPLILAGAGGCACERGPQPQRLPKAEIAIGDIELAVEVAATASQRQTGMMYRKKLGPDEGMLFIFDRDRNLSFFMKNTYAPLSIAFIRSDGIISNIARMEPLTLSPHHSRTPSRYALEMPQGWFAEHGVEAGSKIVIPPDLADRGESE